MPAAAPRRQDNTEAPRPPDLDYEAATPKQEQAEPANVEAPERTPAGPADFTNAIRAAFDARRSASELVRLTKVLSAAERIGKPDYLKEVRSGLAAAEFENEQASAEKERLLEKYGQQFGADVERFLALSDATARAEGLLQDTKRGFHDADSRHDEATAETKRREELLLYREIGDLEKNRKDIAGAYDLKGPEATILREDAGAGRKASEQPRLWRGGAYDPDLLPPVDQKTVSEITREKNWDIKLSLETKVENDLRQRNLPEPVKDLFFAYESAAVSKLAAFRERVQKDGRRTKENADQDLGELLNPQEKAELLTILLGRRKLTKDYRKVLNLPETIPPPKKTEKPKQESTPIDVEALPPLARTIEEFNLTTNELGSLEKALQKTWNPFKKRSLSKKIATLRQKAYKLQERWAELSENQEKPE